MIRFTTNKGVIDIELNKEEAPVTCENFLRYVNEGFYNGVIFHRVIKNFMIQGGGFLPGMREKETHEPIINEANNGLKNEKYTIAMARTSDPNSATAQFFINSVDNDFLNHTSPSMHGWGYAVFGRVVAGQDVVDAISRVQTTSVGWFQDVPVEDVVIEKAEVIED
ncbi:MAG: peptidylprolyl isomerase [Sutterella sp.]|nr:peptidylprolyl isomerase [Sutterella sp.]